MMGLVSCSKKPEVASPRPRGGDIVANAVSLRLMCAGRGGDTPNRTHPPKIASAMSFSDWSKAERTLISGANSETETQKEEIVIESESP